jgi:DNA-binding NarL/FixJ family response regulator
MRIDDLFERHKKHPPELIKAVCSLWDQGFDYKTIANQVSITPQAVNKIILRNYQERTLRRNPVKDTEIQQISTLYNQGMRVSEISKKLNLTWGRVKSIIKNHVIK